jgi:sugar diacid utilization regulator
MQFNGKEMEEMQCSKVSTAVSTIGSLTAAEVPLEEMLDSLAKAIRSTADVRRASIFLREEESPGLFYGRAIDTIGDPCMSKSVTRLICGVPADGFTLEMVGSGRPVLVSNARTDPRPVRSAVLNLDLHEVLGAPMTIRGETLGLIFLDDPGERHGFDEEDEELAHALAQISAMAISQANGIATLRASAARVSRQNQLLRRRSKLQERLTELALEGSSIQDVAEAVVAVVGEPCLIYDPDRRRLAASSPEGRREPVRSVLDPGKGQDVAEAKGALATVAEQGVSIVGPFPRLGLHRRCAIAPITVRDATLGHLVITEQSRRLSAVDIGVARQAASIAAFELTAVHRGEGFGSGARDALLRDLFSGSGSEDSLIERARTHGLRIDRRHAVCLLRGRGHIERGFGCAEVEAALAGVGLSSPCVATALEDGSVALLVTLDSDLLAMEASSQLKRLLELALALLSPNGEILAAISSSALLPNEVGSAFEEAENVMSCLATLEVPGGGSVLTADDLGVGRLILASSDRGEAARFARQNLGPLLEDGQGRGDLMTTLSAFVDCGRSVKRTAAALRLHENTIRYRLARVTEVTGLDLMTNPDHQLSCQLSVLIMRLQGDLSTPVTTPEVIVAELA